MPRISINAMTFYLARQRLAKGHPLSEEFLRETNTKFLALARRFPEQVKQVSLGLVDSSSSNPLQVTEAEFSDDAIKQVIGPLRELVEQRMDATRSIVLDALDRRASNARRIVAILGQWMLDRAVVRLIGAGRALLAGSLPANRLAHGGANVWILGDRSPLPNSKLGGGIIAVSASGKTKTVLDIMKLAQEVNRERALRKQQEIVVIGVSKASARGFQMLCSEGCFIGIRSEPFVSELKLRALGDIEEYAISELLDALVVAAGLEIGTNFRMGHEDLVGGMTGPWHQHR